MPEHILQPHELAARGLTTIKPGPATSNPVLGEETAEVPLYIDRSGDTYTAEEDVTHTLPDGRTIQVIGKGHTIPIDEAKRLGLIKPEQKQGPTETKPAPAPKEKK